MLPCERLQGWRQFAGSEKLPGSGLFSVASGSSSHGPQPPCGSRLTSAASLPLGVKQLGPSCLWLLHVLTYFCFALAWEVQISPFTASRGGASLHLAATMTGSLGVVRPWWFCGQRGQRRGL